MQISDWKQKSKVHIECSWMRIGSRRPLVQIEVKCRPAIAFPFQALAKIKDPPAHMLQIFGEGLGPPSHLLHIPGKSRRLATGVIVQDVSLLLNWGSSVGIVTGFQSSLPP
jgi:hypothetical protein